MELRETFDAAAALFHEARPGYPEALFDDIVALAALGPGARVLEVGTGTGIATLPLARRGLRVTALEPGPALAAEARRRLAPHIEADRVEVVERTLEAWPAERGAFDLAVAATSWHWEQPRGYRQLARALAPRGPFALFRHHHVGTPADGGFFLDVAPVYLEHAPSIWRNEPMPAADDVADERTSLLASGVFAAVDVRRYRWDEMHDADRYVRILRTFSEHVALPAAACEALLAGVRAHIDERLGSTVTKGYLVILHVAHR